MKNTVLAMAMVAIGATPVIAEDENVYTFKNSRAIFYCESYEPLTEIFSKDIASNIVYIVSVTKTPQNPNAPCDFVKDASGTNIQIVNEISFNTEVQHNNAAVDGVGSLVKYGRLLAPASDTIRYVVLMQYFKADAAGVYQPQGWFEPIGNNYLNALLAGKKTTP